MKKIRKTPEERASMIKRIVQQVSDGTKASEFFKNMKISAATTKEDRKEKEADTDPTTPAE